LLPRSSATARPNGLKEGLGTLGGRDRAALEIRPSEETGNGRQKVGKGRRGKREEQRGEGGIYGRREKQQGDCARAFLN
jgi:hypothetical protein